MNSLRADTPVLSVYSNVNVAGAAALAARASDQGHSSIFVVTPAIVSVTNQK